MRRLIGTLGPLWLGSLLMGCVLTTVDEFKSPEWGEAPASRVTPTPTSSSTEAGAMAPLPWETWRDLRRLPVLEVGSQSLLHSSRCPDGCRYDRHSADQSRFLYASGDEGVVFEEAGAGAITRIWMTMGEGVSQPLDPEIRLRIYVDQASEPVVDLPLPALFDGTTPPFLPPLVGHRLQSSGGNFSYVPIAYRQGCRVTLVGAETARIWFQFNHIRRSTGDGIVSFDGSEDLGPLVALLAGSGQDPWPPDPHEVDEGVHELAPGSATTVSEWFGVGTLTGLRLDLPPEVWGQVDLRLRFDEKTRVALPLLDFFGIGRTGELPTRSLLVGTVAGRLYSYFPMPFHEKATVELVNRGAASVVVNAWVRADRRPPPAQSGYFGAQLAATDSTQAGEDHPVLRLTGRGKLVGRFLEVGATEGRSRQYLEGDERGFIDGSQHPGIYGTGVEDYFNGGFYFDQGPFGFALHGAPYTSLLVDSRPTTAAYRVQLSDGVTFENGYFEGLESGPTNNLPMRLRATTWFYQLPEPGLYLWDRLELGSASSRSRHAYIADGPIEFQVISSSFESEPLRSISQSVVTRPSGTARFELRGHSESTVFRLRRRFDALEAGQTASVEVSNQPVTSFPSSPGNSERRWRELDLGLASPRIDGGRLSLSVEAPATGHDGEPLGFSEIRYELWADGPGTVFQDGFESGDLSAWLLP